MKKKYIFVQFFSFFLLVFSFTTASDCVPSVGIGEVTITDNYTSAKEEAIARAKWDAITKAFGEDINVKEVMENFQLLDQVVVKKIGGFVKDIKVLNEEIYQDPQNHKKYLKVEIETCVYPKKAEEALALLTKNTSINIIFITEKDGRFVLDEANPVSTQFVQSLIDQGFQIYDLTSHLSYRQIRKIESSIKNGNLIYLKNLLSKNFAGALIIGKIYFKNVSQIGQDIGYGITNTFSVVKAFADYYLVTKDKNNLRILASGNVSSKGIGLNTEIAKQKALSKLSQELTDDILEKIDNYLLFKQTNVIIVVEDLNSVSKNFEIRNKLQKLPWVESVDIIGKGKFKVKYLENPIYLANSLEKIYNYKVVEFSPTKIIISLN